MEKKIGSHLKFATPLAQAVIDGLKKRFGHLLDQDLDHEDAKKARDVKEAILATVSHPKFKRLPIKDHVRAKEMLIEDSTQHWSGRHYMLTLPLTIGPDGEESYIYLLLSKKIKLAYQIFLHDPKFFIFSDNPIAFPMESMLFKTELSNSHCYRLNLIQMNELNVPSDPCNSDTDFNFWACVKESVSQKVILSGHMSVASTFCRLAVAPSGTPQPKKLAQAANNSGEILKQTCLLKLSLSEPAKGC